LKNLRHVSWAGESMMIKGEHLLHETVLKNAGTDH
jgi:hypothetical protein